MNLFGIGTTPSEDAVAEMRRALRWALILTAVAGAFRLFRLGEWSFWSDEISTLRDAADLHNVLGYPVGYAIIGLMVKLFGSSELVARLVPALAGAVTVPVLFLIGRRFFSMRASLLAAGLMAVSSYHIFFSQYARYYTLLVLFGMLGVWTAWLGLERNNRRLLVTSAALMTLTFMTHWTAALLLAALAVYFIWMRFHRARPAGATWTNAAILFGPFLAGGLLFATYFVRFLSQWQGGENFSLLRSGLMVLKLADRLEPAALLCAAAGVWLLGTRDDRRTCFLLCIGIVPCLLAILFVGFSSGGSRFALVALPAFLLLAGAGLDMILRGASRERAMWAWALVGLVFLALLLKDGLYFTVERGQRPRWKEATLFVVASEPQARFIVTTPEIFRHYAPDRQGVQGINDVNFEDLRRELSDPARSTWIIIERVSNVAPKKEVLDLVQSKARLAREFPLRVQMLDYSIGVYRAPAVSAANGN